MYLEQCSGAIGEVFTVMAVQYQVGIPASRHHSHTGWVCVCALTYNIVYIKTAECECVMFYALYSPFSKAMCTSHCKYTCVCRLVLCVHEC